MLYFDGLFLKQEEFILEQNYNIILRRFHNRYFHSWGIVHGLDVVKNDNGDLFVTPGVALDKSNDTYKYLDTELEVSREIIITELKQVKELPNDGSVYICISYHEDEDFTDAAKGGEKKIHWWENPAITAKTTKPNANGSEIILAKVKRENGKVTSIDYSDENGKSLRTYAGAYGKLTLNIENEDDETKLPSIQGSKIDNMNGILINANTTKFSGKLEVNDIVKANKFVGDGSGLTGLKAGQWNDVAGGGIFYNAGNVGIGTDSPSKKLEVKGDIKITDGKIIQDEWTPANLISENGWKDFGEHYNTSGYFIDKNGIVHLKGRVKDGQLTKAVFTLPVGFRPTNTETFSVASAAGTNTVEIQKDGSVIVKTGSPAWVSLDGINFRAGQG